MNKFDRFQEEPLPIGDSGDTQLEYDVFISHASEDKDEVVRPLANALLEKGLKVWYDEFELKIGDSLRRKIDRGLAKSKYTGNSYFILFRRPFDRGNQ